MDILYSLDCQFQVEARREEQRQFGVFFDDDYDYMQHLKDTNEIYQVGIVDRVYSEHNGEVKVRTEIRNPSCFKDMYIGYVFLRFQVWIGKYRKWLL